MTPILLRILACALLGAGATGWHAGSDALRLGQRVLTEVSATGPTAPPAVSGEADLTQVDPLTWRMVSLRMPDHSHPGSYLEVELLRPLGWINERKAAVGRWINFSVPELRISGMAEVTGIDACPPIESGYGRVVLGTFTSVSSDVYELKLAGQDEAIGVTYGHPIWSLDRGDWIAAGALRPGERLATAAGAAVVESVTVLPGERRVYNLSVEGDRRYLVGSVAVLAHNVGISCDLDVPALDSTGKLHGELPPRGTIPRNWSREDMEELVPQLRASIAKRQADMHNPNLGWDYRHRDRLVAESQLLRLIEKYLLGS